MKLITEIYVHKTLEIFIWYIRPAGRTNISPGNAIFAFLMGPQLALGAPNPYFPCHNSFKYLSKRNKLNVSPPSSSEQSLWIVLNALFSLESLAELFNKAPLVSLLMCFFCSLFQGVPLISQSCFHRGTRQDCCSSLLSSVSSSFPACRFRKRKDKSSS